MNESTQPEIIIQRIFENVTVGGNLTVGDIQQIINIYKFSEKFRPKNTPHNIPRSNTIKFVGRAESLHEVHQQLQDNGQLAITAVKGMGGIGKTELAIQYSYVYLLAKSYQGGICWLKAREENVGLQVLRFARNYLGIEPPDDQDLESQVEYCWSRWQSVKEGEVLVVIDDMTDYEDIEPYLPPQPSNFKILITTRLNIEDLPSIPLDVLVQEDAIELLRQWVGKDKIDEQIEDVKELCEQLGNLPLALNLVGRYVQKRKITIRELLTRLEEKGLSYEALVIDKKKDPTLKASTKRIKRGVAAALELSWEELSDEAKHLGRVLSIFALAPIKWELIRELEKDTDLEDLESDRIELEELHLLRSPEDNIYQFHQLIREYFQVKLGELSRDKQDNFKRNFVELMVAQSTKMPETPTQNNINTFELSISHIMEVANCLNEYLVESPITLEIFWIYTCVAKFYQGQGLYDLAIPWSKKCVEQIKKRLGEQHPQVANSLNNLAVIYQLQGRYQEAESLYLQKLELLDLLRNSE